MSLRCPIRTPLSNWGTDFVDEFFIRWYIYYLNNRFITIKLNGAQVTKRCTRGVPQGGVLSPLAFACATEDVLELFKADEPGSANPPATAGSADDSDDFMGFLPRRKRTKRKRGRRRNRRPPRPPRRVTVSTTAFADDLCFYITGGTPAELQQKAQEVMTKASAWSKTKGMAFSTTKTEAIIFSRRKYDKPANIILDGKPLEYSTVVKYLGVYIDHKLMWKDHIDIKLTKAKRLLMNIVRVCHPTYGVAPIAAAYYWKCCILPMFTYGTLVWHRGCKYKHIQSKLKKFQRLALKMMGPLCRSCPTRGLEVINYFRPIELECRRIAAEAYIRTEGHQKIDDALMHTTKTTQKGHRQLCSEFLHQIQYPFFG